MQPPHIPAADAERYSRHLGLPGFTPQHQARLQASRVLLVGAGGLGSPGLPYLLAAGVGQLTVLEPGPVQLSALHRQPLYRTAHVGQPKAALLTRQLADLNPGVDLQVLAEPLTLANARQHIGAADVVVDGSDNFATRYLVNDVAVALGKPVVYGSVYQWEGQVAVWNGPSPGGGRGPNYRCLHPTPPDPATVPTCDEGGVLGPVPGVVGSLQALEALKLLTGLGQPLVGRLAVWDALNATWQHLTLLPDPDNPLQPGTWPPYPGWEDELQTLSHACGLGLDVPTLHPAQAAELPGVMWVDVRTAPEVAAGAIPHALHVPMAAIPQGLPAGQPLVLYCQTGRRSARAVAQVLAAQPGRQVYSLAGGWAAWQAHQAPVGPA